MSKRSFVAIKGNNHIHLDLNDGIGGKRKKPIGSLGKENPEGLSTDPVTRGSICV